MDHGGEAKFRLKIASGAREGEEFPVDEGGTISIGRKATNTISLKEVQVSGSHAKVICDADGPRLKDLGSTNGSWLDGRKVQEAPLDHGDRIKIGTTEFVFEIEGQEAVAASPAADVDHDESEPMSVSAPKPRSKLVPLLSLLGLLVVLGGAAFVYFANPFKESVDVESLPPAAGNLAGNAWSFEVGGDEEGRIQERHAGLPGFRMTKSAAKSGARGLSAKVSQGQRRMAAFSGLPVQAGRIYEIEISSKAADGASGILGVELMDDQGQSLISRRLAETTGGGFSSLKGQIVVPETAKTLDILFAAVGAGTVSFDDLSIVESSASSPSSQSVGAYQATVESERLVLNQPGGASIISGVARLQREQSEAEDEEDVEIAGSSPPALSILPSALLKVVGEHQIADGQVKAKLALDDSIEGDRTGLGFLFLEGSLVRAITTRGSVETQPSGAFRVDGVESLLLGEGISLASIEFDEAQTIVGDTYLGGQFLGVDSGSFSFTIRANFDEERVEARRLVSEAQALASEGKDGEAYRAASKVLRNLPYDQEQFDKANEVASRLLGSAKSAQDGLEELIESSAFLESPTKLEEARKQAEVSAARFEGTPYEESFADFLAQAEENMLKAKGTQRVRVAEKLFRSGSSLLAVQGREVTGSLILRYVRDKFSDTEWAARASEILDG